MCSITKVLLLLAVLVCIAIAQRHETARCLCSGTRNKFGRPNEIKEIQIYAASPFCDRLEIVVNLKNGRSYCLDPGMKRLIAHITSLMKKKRASSTPSPTESSSFQGSTESSGSTHPV